MKRKQHAFVYGAAALLMLVRVDIWWWGETTAPVALGWLTLPMVYQLGIWLCGWLLVLYAAGDLWSDNT